MTGSGILPKEPLPNAAAQEPTRDAFLEGGSCFLPDAVTNLSRERVSERDGSSLHACEAILAFAC